MQRHFASSLYPIVICLALSGEHYIDHLITLLSICYDNHNQQQQQVNSVLLFLYMVLPIGIE